MSELDQEIMTREEVAALLRIPPDTLRYWQYTDKGPASVRIGKYRRWRRADVLSWIDDQQAEQQLAKAK
jgi:DNA-binding transcriptional MerR regulator